ncbi:hypothetical protein E4U52_004939, partial [Claviceps spartinae]
MANVKCTVAVNGILMNVGLITLDEGGEEVKIRSRMAELIFLQPVNKLTAQFSHLNTCVFIFNVLDDLSAVLKYL